MAVQLQEASEAKSEILRRSGGTLERRKGVYIVQLSGTYEQMGRQHGELAAAACGDVVPRYFGCVVENIIGHAVPSLGSFAGRALKLWFHLRNRARIQPELREHLRAFSIALGKDPGEAERTFVVPDVIHYLIGRAFPPLAVPPACSGFFACGGATLGGKLLIGRNFDFFGRNVWNTNNALIVMRPDNGQAFCWCGALGAPGGAQGFNASGLVISLHTKFTRDVRSWGVPIFQLCHDVLAKCTNLEEAFARITEQPRMCGLTMFVVDSRRRDAAAIGFSARHVEVVRPENGVLVRTNHYVTGAMKKTEVTPHPWQRNSCSRFQRVGELLAERHGALAPDDIPAILSDCFDPYEQRRRVAGDVVAGTNNAQCIAMSPDDDAIWIGGGDYPVCHSTRFAGFRISALLAGDTANYDLDDLPGACPLDEKERAALHEYEEAWSAYNDGMDSARALEHLRRAAALLPEECIFPRVAGILLLKEKRYAEALPLLLRVTEYDYRNTLMRAEAHVWAGRCLDLLSRRAKALAHYEQARALDTPPVSAAAARHLTKPFRPRHLFDVSPEFIVGTGIAPYKR